MQTHSCTSLKPCNRIQPCCSWMYGVQTHPCSSLVPVHLSIPAVSECRPCKLIPAPRPYRHGFPHRGADDLKPGSPRPTPAAPVILRGTPLQGTDLPLAAATAGQPPHGTVHDIPHHSPCAVIHTWFGPYRTPECEAEFKTVNSDRFLQPRLVVGALN